MVIMSKQARPRAGFLGLGRIADVPQQVNDEELIINLVDCDYTVMSYKGTPGIRGHSKRAVIRLFGLTLAGASVMVRVHHVEPYMYVKLNMSAEEAAKLTKADLVNFRRELNRRLDTPEIDDPLANFDEAAKKAPSRKRSHPGSNTYKKKRSYHSTDDEDVECDEDDLPDDEEEEVFDDGDLEMIDDGEVTHEEDSDDEDDEEEEVVEAIAAAGSSSSTQNKGGYRPEPHIVSLQLEMNRSVYGYCGKRKSPFLKIFTRLPSSVPKVRALAEGGTVFLSRATGGKKIQVNSQVFEANVDFALRFMIDHDIVGCGWLRLKKWTKPVPQENDHQLKAGFAVRPNNPDPPTDEPLWYDTTDPATMLPPSRGDIAAMHYPYMVDVDASNVVGIPLSDAEYSNKLPKLRKLSFDIEVAGKNSRFPIVESDPIISIGLLVVLETGQKIMVTLQLGSADNPTPLDDKSITEYHLLTFSNERDLLLAFTALYLLIDADIVESYNGNAFDFPYILQRAERFGVSDVVACLGRVRGEPTVIRDGTFTSRAFGSSKTVDVIMAGRASMDLLTYIQRTYKLRSYSLNAVSTIFLKKQKKDMKPSYITPGFLSGSKDRKEIDDYCNQDCYLPEELGSKLMLEILLIEMAKVTGVLLPWLLSKGQGIKVFSQLLRRTREKGYLVPSYRVPENPDGGYPGATVIEPQRGYYDRFIATLDFASLYPTIMMANNTCYSTLLLSREHAEAEGLVEGVDFYVSPSDDLFVLPNKEPGLLPEMLADLLKKRADTKTAMKKMDKNSFEHSVYDVRQSQLKISANSIYGFTGAVVGKLPCLQIGRTVTGFGRKMLDRTQELVEHPNLCDPKTGLFIPDTVNETFGCKVIYGDTDSVMIKILLTPEELAIISAWRADNITPEFIALMDKSLKMYTRAADYVTQFFKKPIKLEFEKIFFPYLLVNKKRYSGLKWVKATKWDSHDIKGLETGRRDGCRLGGITQKECLRILKEELSPVKAESYVRNVVADLYADNVPWELLIMTRGWTREVKNKQPHTELVNRMRERDPRSVPRFGSRISFMIKHVSDKRAKLCEKSEDPSWMIEHGETPDIKYYLETQLMGPINRILEPVMGDRVATLWTGDHTRVRVKGAVVAGSSNNTGLFGSATVHLNACLNCKASIPTSEEDQGLCGYCQDSRSELIIHRSKKLKIKEKATAALWSNCQRCVKDRHNPNRCGDVDCEFFFRRTLEKVKLNVVAAEYDRLNSVVATAW